MRRAALPMAAGLLAALLGFGWVYIRHHRFDALIAEVSNGHGLDASLVSAVVWRESHYDPYQVGRAGEVGLMQVSREAGREWAKAAAVNGFSSADLFDPRTNINVGATVYFKVTVNGVSSGVSSAR